MIEGHSKSNNCRYTYPAQERLDAQTNSDRHKGEVTASQQMGLEGTNAQRNEPESQVLGSTAYKWDLKMQQTSDYNKKALMEKTTSGYQWGRGMAEGRNRGTWATKGYKLL